MPKSTQPVEGPRAFAAYVVVLFAAAVFAVMCWALYQARMIIGNDNYGELVVTAALVDAALWVVFWALIGEDHG